MAGAHALGLAPETPSAEARSVVRQLGNGRAISGAPPDAKQRLPQYGCVQVVPGLLVKGTHLEHCIYEIPDHSDSFSDRYSNDDNLSGITTYAS